MLINNEQYFVIVENIKNAQYKAAVSVNSELVMRYYNIGGIINQNKVWGNKFIDNLSSDIKAAFPETTGYSVRNLKYMAKLASEYPDREFVQHAVAQIPWGHNVVIMDKIETMEQRVWYIQKTIENGWSRDVLVHQIESGLYERQEIVEKITNFEKHLPAPQSELATQTMKDPYIFDFIALRENMKERDTERALVKDVTSLLLELGNWNRLCLCWKSISPECWR